MGKKTLPCGAKEMESYEKWDPQIDRGELETGKKGSENKLTSLEKGGNVPGTLIATITGQINCKAHVLKLSQPKRKTRQSSALAVYMFEKLWACECI